MRDALSPARLILTAASTVCAIICVCPVELTRFFSIVCSLAKVPAVSSERRKDDQQSSELGAVGFPGAFADPAIV